MNNSLFNRRIPTLLAMILLLGGIGVASYLTNSSLQLTSQASPDEKPQNIRVTNVTDSSFTVTYTTAKNVLGTVSYGTTQSSQTALDDRDKKSKTPGQYTVHSITVSGLTPDTGYIFSILSGGSVFLDDGKPFTIKTGKKLDGDQEGTFTITGTVLSSEGSKPGTVLVAVTSQNAQMYSVLSDTNGNYLLKLSKVRTKDLSAFAALTPDTKMDLIALNNSATTRASFLLQDPSVPTITLSQNYDFTLGREIILPQAASDAGSFTFPVLQVNPVESATVTIASPEKDESFPDLQPKFSGSAAPSESVEITLRSEEQQVTVQTDSKGNWTYRPSSPLEPGEHTITIKARDGKGILREVTRNFIVLAEGSQFTEPSVSPISSQSPTQTPTPTRETPSSTPTPIVHISPEETPSPTEFIAIPTTIPSPTVTPRPSIQPTGNTSLNTVGLLAFMMMAFGAILLIFTKGIRI
ncbi:MAG: hypothetical protein RLZZ455_442 [Candidatus Parcubacteria bacterium]|jgi:hypothetical protein